MVTDTHADTLTDMQHNDPASPRTGLVKKSVYRAEQLIEDIWSQLLFVTSTARWCCHNIIFSITFTCLKLSIYITLNHPPLDGNCILVLTLLTCVQSQPFVEYYSYNFILK